MDKLPFETVKREILIKRIEQTDSKYGCIPEKRRIKIKTNGSKNRKN